MNDQQETMTVTVMYRNNPKTVTISANCPKCGQRRGTPTWHQQCEDGEWFSLNVWTNECGHRDMYSDVLRESAKLAQSQPV